MKKWPAFQMGKGLFHIHPANPGKDGSVVSFNMENDLEGAIERVIENNGSIIQGKTKIEAEGRGYFTLFIDSEGNKVGLYGDE